MIQRVYIDTSVIDGLFDEEFQLFTQLFFDRVFRGEIRLITSDLLDAELITAPERVSVFYRSLPPQHLEFVRANKESDSLADKYIVEKVVGLTSLADCQHIAIATIIKRMSWLAGTFSTL